MNFTELHCTSLAFVELHRAGRAGRAGKAGTAGRAGRASRAGRAGRAGRARRASQVKDLDCLLREAKHVYVHNCIYGWGNNDGSLV